jgi:hypothetical protein
MPRCGLRTDGQPCTMGPSLNSSVGQRVARSLPESSPVEGRAVTRARHRVGMVRTRIPQRAVTQQPRQKGNVAPWTGDLCLSGGGGLGSSQKGALRFRPGSLVIRSRAPTAAPMGSEFGQTKSPSAQSSRGRRTPTGGEGMRGPHSLNRLDQQTFHVERPGTGQRNSDCRCDKSCGRKFPCLTIP